MRAGYARVCINPPYGAPIVGYYEKRFTKGIADDLFARAVAFDDGEKKAVVIALDLCYLNQARYDEFKAAIVAATGMDKDAIFINCSHTHTGPMVGNDFASDLKCPDHYVPFVCDCVRDAAVYAIQDLKEIKMEIAEGEAKNISFVRRYRMKDGSVATNPGVGNPNIDHALGEPNETVKLPQSDIPVFGLAHWLGVVHCVPAGILYTNYFQSSEKICFCVNSQTAPLVGFQFVHSRYSFTTKTPPATFRRWRFYTYSHSMVVFWFCGYVVFAGILAFKI